MPDPAGMTAAGTFLGRVQGTAAALLLALALVMNGTGCSKVAPSSTGAGTTARNPWTIPGHLRLGVTDEPDALNPFFSHNAAADVIETLLFAYVFRYDAHGNLMPEVAREVPTHANGGISRDNKTITLHIRPGLTWSDGAPLDARDLRFTWRAAIDNRNNTKIRIGWDDVNSMDVPNPTTLVVHLKRVNSAIISQIWGGGGGSSYPPLPEHLLGKLPDLNHAAFNTAPISSGPWLLAAWNHGSSLEFVPNPRYWRGAPKLHNLTWKIVPNPDTLFAELQTHEVDVYDNIPETQIPRLPSLQGVKATKRLIANWRHLELNTRRPQLADVRVRRAIAEAIDWDRINVTVYHGVNVRATSDIVPDSWAAPKIPLFVDDPAAAKRLLDAAGWKPDAQGIRQRDGIPLAIVIASTNKPGNEQAEVQMQQQLRAVGIDVTIKNYPPSLLFAQNGPLYTGKYDMSWSIDTNGPEPDNAGNWSGNFIPPNGANTAFLNDPIITQTSEGALKTFDRAQRKALYAREEERIHEMVPVVFLYWEVSYVAYNSDLRHYVPAEYDMAGAWNSYEWEI
jgi:peptide/nickel transport system substrate-binding protein